MSKALAVNATVSGRQRFFDFLYKWGMLLTVVLLVAVFGLASDNFLDPFNIINILRSIPFLILMAAVIPFSRFIMGTALGVAGAIVPLSLAAIPLFARLIETSLREVQKPVLDAGLAASGTRWQVIFRVQLPEALPGIVGNVTIATVGIVEFTAVAGAVGAGGLGYLALSYGYSRFDGNMMLACVVVLVVIAQITQFSGDRLARALAK